MPESADMDSLAQAINRLASRPVPIPSNSPPFQDSNGSPRRATLDESGNLQMATASANSIGSGSKTVSTAGTDVALASSTACKSVVIQALDSNTGVIAVGSAGVDAATSGIVLNPGDSVEMDVSNLGTIYIDATVSGEGVRYTYVY